MIQKHPTNHKYISHKSHYPASNRHFT